MEEPKVHAGGFYSPANETRTGRRAHRVAAKRLSRETRGRRRAEARAVLEADKAADTKDGYLPAGGDTGPAALRSYRRFRVQQHRATSEVLAGAYPFLAEAGLGSEGTFIGKDAWSGGGFCFDPWVLYQRGVITNPNCLLAGVVGKGKSFLAKSMATRSMAFGRRVYVPGDPKGEWTVVAKAVGGVAIELGAGSGNRLNPLDEGPRPRDREDSDWSAVVANRRRTLLGALAESALARPMTAVEHTALDLALRDAAEHNAVPTLPMVVDALFQPRTAESGASVRELIVDGRHLGHALRRLFSGDLAGLFDGPSTVSFDPSLPTVSLDLSQIQGSDQLIAMVMTCASA